MESKAQNFCSCLSLSIPYIHTIPPFTGQRCPSSLSTGCCLVRFHPFFTFSTTAVLPFTFVILQPLCETDETHRMFYFHNISILSIETQAGIPRMTLKKSLFTFYNITLQEDDLARVLLNRAPFSQLREGVFMYHFWKILCSSLLKNSPIVSLTGTMKRHQYCQIQPRVIRATIKYDVYRNYLLQYKNNQT